jgi:hypothetical protein
MCLVQYVRKIAVHLGYGTVRYVDLVVSIEVAVEVCCCFTVFICYTAVEVFNCLIQFLLTMVLSIEERVFLVEYFFREGNRYSTRLLSVRRSIVIAHACVMR